MESAIFDSRIVIPCCLLCTVFNEPAPRRTFFVISQTARTECFHSAFFTLHSAFLFGGHKAVVRPVPIPNTAVKHSLADGSGPIGSARVGCRQLFRKSRNRSVLLRPF